MTGCRAPGVGRISGLFRGMWFRTVGLLLLGVAVRAQPFGLPTTNTFLFEAGMEDRFFAPTPGRTWESGTFGCVRADRYGSRLHEGLDIRSLVQDRRGEPEDPVLASADGVVAYVSRKAGNSNYGIYLLIRHGVEGLEVYSLYAHLRAVEPGLRMGSPVRAGDRVGTMGRTTNTRESIGKDRAHVHFEIDLVVNGRFLDWYRTAFPGSPNDHGNFNGYNLLGIDPAAVYREQKRLGTGFSLVRLIREQPVLCRVVLPKPDLQWARRYRPLVDPNPVAERDGVAGYELFLAFNGIPVRAVPRSRAELEALGTGPLVAVDEAVWREHPCGRLVTRQGQAWVLQSRGRQLLDLLAF